MFTEEKVTETILVEQIGVKDGVKDGVKEGVKEPTDIQKVILLEIQAERS